MLGAGRVRCGAGGTSPAGKLARTGERCGGAAGPGSRRRPLRAREIAAPLDRHAALVGAAVDGEK